jgi:hypothetical protein
MALETTLPIPPMFHRWRATLALGAAALASCAALPTAAGGAGEGGERADWIPLFDGRSLDGWVASGGRYDGNARWTVEDGCLTGRQSQAREGGLIYTADEYSDFELECQVKIDWPFDSGVFLRMVPPAPRGSGEQGMQVTLDHRPDGEIAGLYSDGWVLHNPAGAQRFAQGGWNHLRVECTGSPMQLRVWLNGALECEHALESAAGQAPRGRIGLQVHGGEDVPLETKVQFKDIRLRAIEPADEPLFRANAAGLLELTHAGRLAGWRELMSGPDLAGWEVVGDAYGIAVEAGVLKIPSLGDGYLRTLADFRDFDLRLDFRLHAMANSGVFLRGARAGGNPAYSGCEVQILDDFDWERESGQTLQPWQHTGSLYGAVAAPWQAALKPLGEWNTFEIRFQGPHLETRLNGHELYDVDVLGLAQADPPFRERAASGFIGLQRHAGAAAGGAPPDESLDAPTGVEFRNLFVRRLP